MLIPDAGVEFCGFRYGCGYGYVAGIGLGMGVGKGVGVGMLQVWVYGCSALFQEGNISTLTLARARSWV